MIIFYNQLEQKYTLFLNNNDSGTYNRQHGFQ